MKKITAESFSKLVTCYHKPKEKFGVMKAIENLEVGEALVVDYSEYTGRVPFSSKVHSTFGRGAHGKHYTVKTLDANEGWAVLRTD